MNMGILADGSANPYRKTHFVLIAVVCIGAALASRASIGYGGFPIIDDYAYVPLGWAGLDSSLYPRDIFIQNYVLHAPLWPGLIALADSVFGLPPLLWAITLLLSLATVIALFRILRAMGTSGHLLPLVCALTFAGEVRGLGRGQYGGLFAEHFHMHWLALVLGLFIFDALLRRQELLTGLLIGLAAIVHALDAAHIAAVVAFSLLLEGRRGLLPILKIAGLSFIVSLPVSIPIAKGFFEQKEFQIGNIESLILNGFHFRAPHHYEIGLAAAAMVLLIASLGVLGLTAMRFSRRDTDNRFGGLWLGQFLLLVLSLTFFLGDEIYSWRAASILPYILDLTRTTPLIIAVSALALAVGAERDLLSPPDRERDAGNRMAWLVMWSLASLGLITVFWFNISFDPWIYGICLIAIVTLLFYRRSGARPLLATIWAIVCVSAAAGLTANTEIERAPPADEQELYAWAKDETTRESLFIIPPSFEAFRLYGQRGVYVDFKLHPTGQPALVAEWRRRLEEVALPDGLAREGMGYPALFDWDRVYASRNTPLRIAELLERTGADYFVWDRKAYERPPYVERPRPPSPILEVAFESERFLVYRLLGG